ncbi:3-hydroxybutyryl-CoA dehydrogenase [Aminipila butyrica]|uniref:3-hydroxybutyryl-CoA dehydrogenase n=1 Tax=Aminipila butyrica TaxID=433296 RepID=A0A858BXD3_9FIRM|nr:3-hydroxyacyl-CoA dehydrogenase NAD-binding domain-containing protein [Aminipila butyrica]QIB69560.1 3-hydroxybutyryl-CoA dehydrogenase [Aminipila butyrica]
MSVKKLFIIGAGFMGMGIAQTAITRGIQVMVNDISDANLAKGRKTVETLLQKSVKKGKMTESAMEEALALLSLTTSVSDCKDADFIIEAAPENENLKVSLIKEVDKYAKAEAIISSNTSSISITTLASCLKDPSRFVGMHFFSPVPLIHLLEVVKGLQTSQATMDATTAFGEQLGKTGIVSKDEPGFIVNRMLIPMLNEAFILIERGIGSIEEIDLGMRKGLNHPMGPLELVDMIGIDVELAVMEVLYSEIGDPKYRPAVLLRRMVAAGNLGRKTGRGFYIYHEDGTRTPNTELM